MKLHRMYFCYGSVLTSTVWIFLLILYWNIQEPASPRNLDGNAVPKLPGIKEKKRTVRRQGLVKNDSVLPDLEMLGLVNNPEEQKQRDEGNLNIIRLQYTDRYQMYNVF